jgi:hypothetical protein
LSKPFSDAGKAIFSIEYTDQSIDFDSACDFSIENGITLILKNRNLDGFIKSCDF